MDTHRKQVVVCSNNHAFTGALRLLLDDLEVLSVPELPEVPPHSDILIYRTNGSLPIKQLSRTAAAVPTLVLAEHDLLISAIEANCRGFLPERSSLEEVREAVDTILNGGAVVPPDLLGAVLRHLVDRRRETHPDIDLDALTEREQEVFELAVDGARKEEIGKRLFISPATARTHLQRVYRKLGVHSQAELIALSTRGLERDQGDEL